MPSVLCCGRIEPDKNQVSLFCAPKYDGIPLTITGMPDHNHPKYVDKGMSRCVCNIQCASGVAQSALVGLYNRYYVHIVPSWFEMNGLVMLGAALCVCKGVSTSRGYAREYFGSMAEYYQPSSFRSIWDSLFRSLSVSSDQDIVRKFRENY